MHLSPRDIDKLVLHGAGSLAQKRLARGLRLNYPETIALLATVLLELVRDGKLGVADLMDVGRRILGTKDGFTVFAAASAEKPSRDTPRKSASWPKSPSRSA